MRRTSLLILVLLQQLTGAPIDGMKKQTVLIMLAFKVGGKVGSGIGSGLIIDERHVVTNHHVCCRVPPGAPSKVLIMRSPKDAIETQVLWSSETQDLALLELAQPLQAPKPVFAPKTLIRIGEPVWAVGFPGSALRLSNEVSAFDPTVTQGVASRIFQSPIESGGTEFVQSTAAINPGNSGGPLFDGCGQAVAINSAKAVTHLGGQEAFAEGINLSILIDELLPELDKHHIAYQVGSPCEDAPSNSKWQWTTQWPALLLAGVAVIIAGHRKTREAALRTIGSRKTGAKPPAARPPQPSRPSAMLVGVAGSFLGQKVPLSEKPCVVGRDPASCNLVFPPEASHVSRQHCQFMHDAGGQVTVEDLSSTHGTFRNNERLPARQRIVITTGDRIVLGDASTAFEVTPR